MEESKKENINEQKEEISEKEKRIRKITKLYYSNPKVQEALVKFAQDREVVPRYFEGFGKRPDSIQYPSDIIGLVNKGATSFHASEELWNDVFQLNSDIPQEQMHELRKSWDLLIDIDSPYFDLSKIAAKLVMRALERYGVKNYGLKYSGSKGFHIIVSGRAFPKEFNGRETRKMFPECPKAITEFLFNEIEPAFMKEAGKIMNLGSKNKDSGKLSIYCAQCNREAKKGDVVKFFCPVCGMQIERKEYKPSKRRLKCLNEGCAGVLEIEEEGEYYFCEYCKDIENKKMQLNSLKNSEFFVERRGEDVKEHVKFDLVLVAPRHLFRMPYSLHEKTALASIVLKKEEIDGFNPRDANPFKIEIRDFIPKNEEGEAKRLLFAALEWKKNREEIEEKIEKRKYEYDDIKIDSSKIKEDMFPVSIKKLLKGMKDGRKRGLFILITFFRSLGFSGEHINNRIREWNKLNEVPLKEGYIKSQIDWHLKQKKKILPPNYNNQAFYQDLGLLDKKPNVKNPIVEVLREVRKRS